MTKKGSSQKNFPIVLAVIVLLLALLFTVLIKRDIFTKKPVAETPKTTPMYAIPQTRTYSDQIVLPKPRLSGGMAVEQAIQERRSRREFSEEPVTLAQLSQLLWSAQGITDPETGHRAAPSARGAYPFTVFVVVRNVNGLEPGLYEYLPVEHTLGDMKLANAGEQLKTAEVQPGAQNAPVVFVLSAAYGKAQEKLGDSVTSSSLLEAGHIGENMYLQTESLRMALVVMAGFDAQKVGDALSLDPAEEVIYLMPFGHRAPETANAVLGSSTGELKIFTAEELAQYDGKEGRKAYAAYEGKVYDFTESEQWKDGEHYGLSAGQDLTGKLGEAPHGGEVVAGFPVVGTFGEVAATQPKEALTSGAAEQSNMMYYLGGGVLIIVVLAAVMMSRRKK